MRFPKRGAVKWSVEWRWCSPPVRLRTKRRPLWKWRKARRFVRTIRTCAVHTRSRTVTPLLHGNAANNGMGDTRRLPKPRSQDRPDRADRRNILFVTRTDYRTRCAPFNPSTTAIRQTYKPGYLVGGLTEMNNFNTEIHSNSVYIYGIYNILYYIGRIKILWFSHADIWKPKCFYYRLRVLKKTPEF